MTHALPSGCGTALITPFRTDGSVDENALRALVEWQLASGIAFLVPCGSTGEAAVLSLAEHRRVVEVVVEQVAGRIPVVAGAGANDTARAMQLSRECAAAGATHLLHVTPMYNRPPQRALLAHFRAVADACALPILVYNVPSRTGVNLEPTTCVMLADDPRFIGVKEASGSLPQIAEIARRKPDRFQLFSGDDGFTLATMAHGGDGVVSVVSNVAPAHVQRLCDAMRRGALDEARRADAALAPLIQTAFVESNPIPVKAMLHALGKCENVLRLPLVPINPDHTRAIDKVAAAFRHR
jgi:4-hydroxy-tetrahydrodipicolinate synthase